MRSAEADLAKAEEANKKTPGAIEPSEVRRLSLAVAKARAQLAQVHEHRPVVDLPTTAKEREAAIRKILDETTEFRFVETPLEDVVALLARKHRIKIQIDRQALDDAGLGTDIAISRSSAGIPLRSALRGLLKHLDLTWEIDNEAILITTVDEAGQRLIRQGYEVSDLVIVEDRVDYGPLVDAIRGVVAPTTWDEVGGPGTLATQHRLVVITQSAEAHEEVAALLADSVACAKSGRTRSKPSQPARQHSRWIRT